METEAHRISEISASELVSLIQDVAAELRGGQRPAAVGLDSKLEADLGLDSLARMELLIRVKRRFGLTLPDEQALAAETPRQLLDALASARPAERAELQPSRAAGSQGAPAAATAPPADAATLVEALAWFAEREPERVHIELYPPSGDGEQETTPISYGQLLAEAQRVAAGLQARDIARGDSVAMMLPTSRDFFVAFFGVLLAGCVPVPIYPPFRPSQLEEHMRRQALILENARAALLIGSPETAPATRWLRSRLVDLRGVMTVAELSAAAAEGGDSPAPPPSAQDLALIQYTSGSTGDPKGVALTHANLVANVRAIGEVVQVQPDDVVVSWLPLYHDMGLIGAWLASLYHGCRLVVMPPTRFLAQPAAWLRALHRHRGTLTAGPNFAYEICASRLTDEDLAGLDLSSWRLALNGAEPVSPATVERFTRRFARYGFRAEAMTPVYGLAECSLALAFTPPGRGPRIDRVERDAFERDSRAISAPSADGSPSPLVFVSAGRPVPRHELRVVDAIGRELPDRRLGRVQFRGPSATSGYFRNPAATRALLAGSWLETGDLGYVADGELYVTGRAKDVIIRAGRHVFPYEIEEVVGGIPGIRRGGVAVFARHDDARGTDAIVVVAETREQETARLAALRASIDERSAALLGTAADEVLLVPPRTIPKTSSGKTRRAACRELYLRGALGHTRSLHRQMLALALGLGAPLARRGLRGARSLAYAAWFWTCFGLLAAPAWLLAMTVPAAGARWRAVSAVVRAFFRATGIPLELRGRQHLDTTPCVLVLNHASYLDGILMVGLLPPGFSLVAKGELAANPFLRLALRRMDVSLVERFDTQRAVQEVAKLEERLRGGGSLLVFPEGTNRRTPGLFPFHQGAFLAAARAGVPVVAGGIVGTRTVLRADQWFPHRGPITVTLRAPRAAGAATWEATLALRDASRREVAALSGEPLVG
jgi:1-acyl-sn-glycerol-3-phosphate acyltransferase